jgi:hypothetical protein
MAAVYSAVLECLPSLACDAQSLHHAHHRHRIPEITAAGRWNVAVGQLLRDVASPGLSILFKAAMRSREGVAP